MGMDYGVFGEQFAMMLSTGGGDPEWLLKKLHVVMALSPGRYRELCLGLQGQVLGAYGECARELDGE